VAIVLEIAQFNIRYRYRNPKSPVSSCCYAALIKQISWIRPAPQPCASCLDSGHSVTASEETCCQERAICYEFAPAPLLGAGASQIAKFVGTENQVENHSVGGTDEVNKWTVALAGLGLLSLESAASSEEQPSSVMTALASTTLSGYVDTSAQWNPGTGNTYVSIQFNSPSKPTA
jgi:hypothetical protein